MTVELNQPFKTEITPEKLAEIFCNMDHREQSKFFNHIHHESNFWEQPFPFQMQMVSDANDLTDGGREIMKTIGGYAEKFQG